MLGFQKSRVEALKMFADLQQKYPALRGKLPDVVESDQTARGLGVIYRVVVGPPSRAIWPDVVLADEDRRLCWLLGNGY